MPKGDRRAIEAFKERFRDENVKVPSSLRAEPPDIIFTGLMEKEEVRAPELVDVMPAASEIPGPDPMAMDPMAMGGGLPAADDPFGDIDLGDVLSY